MTDRAPAALAIRQLSKSYGPRRVLDSLDLDIEAGEIHAVIGQNGSGKSTFIKVLSGYHEPDDGGSVMIAGTPLDFGSPASAYALGLRFVHQDLGLIETMSVLDNLLFDRGYPTRFGTISLRRARSMAKGALSSLGLEVDERAPISELTPTQRTGVAIARATLTDEQHPARLLVLDEPTASFPEEEVERLHALVRRAASTGVGVIYVTHRLDEIPKLCARYTVLRDGVKLLTAETAGVTRSRLVTQLVGTELEEVSREADRVEDQVDRAEGSATTDAALVVEALVAPTLDRVSFEVAPGEIVGVAGITGSGRESLLSVVFGGEERLAGSVRVSSVEVPAGRPDVSVDAGMAFVPADRKNLSAVLSMSATQNVMLADIRSGWRFPAQRGSIESREAHRWFDALQVRPAGGETLPMTSFSGGNQQKIVVARWLRRGPAVLLVDEPTQGIDVGARAVLHHSLIQAAADGAAVVIASSDVDELTAVCGRVLVLSDGRIVAELTGDELTVAGVSRAALHGHAREGAVTREHVDA